MTKDFDIYLALGRMVNFATASFYSIFTSARICHSFYMNKFIKPLSSLICKQPIVDNYDRRIYYFTCVYCFIEQKYFHYYCCVMSAIHQSAEMYLMHNAPIGSILYGNFARVKCIYLDLRLCIFKSYTKALRGLSRGNCPTKLREGGAWCGLLLFESRP